MFSKIVVAFILLFCLTPSESAKKRFNLDLYNITCESFAGPFKRFDCTITQYAPYHYDFSSYIMSKRNLGSQVELRFRIDVVARNAKRAVTFINLKTSLCDVLGHTFQNMLLKTYMDELRRSSNAPYSCPLKGNFLYKLHNFTVSEDMLPVYTPFLNFTFNIEFYENNVLFAKSVATGATIPKRH